MPARCRSSSRHMPRTAAPCTVKKQREGGSGSLVQEIVEAVLAEEGERKADRWHSWWQQVAQERREGQAAAVSRRRHGALEGAAKTMPPRAQQGCVQRHRTRAYVCKCFTQKTHAAAFAASPRQFKAHYAASQRSHAAPVLPRDRGIGAEQQKAYASAPCPRGLPRRRRQSDDGMPPAAQQQTRQAAALQRLRQRQVPCSPRFASSCSRLLP